ncbi:SHOCT domain-containing protein [Pseudomonas shahriarae]|uniref:SHOCT domain-containing protein n=1 Tax=Pseudomonas shahriarae TaxID=2745512 RepID=UPI0023603F86|nr:SHOCT domain-containing protein [Pseudomonas shahriarae]MDD0981713.1 DUF4429 domain-containing protein [Pseudomonas shahriarae]
MDKLLFTAVGATGEVSFTGTSVLIRRKGLLGAMRQVSGIGRGNKDVPLSAVTGVRIEPGSLFTKPFFQLIHSGDVQVQGGANDVGNDDNSVFFGKSAKPDFERLAQLILTAISEMKSAPLTWTLPVEDLTETLKKLAALKDSGVLTEEEFSTKKAEILSRL